MPLTIVRGHVRALVRVQLDALKLRAILVAELIDERSNHSARATPRRPEINQYWRRALKDLLAERIVVYIGHCPNNPCPSVGLLDRHYPKVGRGCSPGGRRALHHIPT